MKYVCFILAAFALGAAPAYSGISALVETGTAAQAAPSPASDTGAILASAAPVD